MLPGPDDFAAGVRRVRASGVPPAGLRADTARDGRAGARVRSVFPWGWGRPKGARPLLVTVGFQAELLNRPRAAGSEKALGLPGGNSGRGTCGPRGRQLWPRSRESLEAFRK